ncbi:hypothetical protein [Sphingomonas sp. Leaf343]|uniref:hypothetical protein n=1 Tax=Sphingomonas sp. Leaf343 TaxID=1736345 RepID=UPI0006FB59DC|nr:hypothetical protein [Sphingomonas sp. Leaf343]KQR83476.1 hypothetical protein ASG07_07045 [Sphingomonas sp. Leaf343]
MIRPRACIAADIHPLGCTCTRCAARASRIGVADRAAMLSVAVITAAAACWVIGSVAVRAARVVFGG